MKFDIYVDPTVLAGVYLDISARLLESMNTVEHWEDNKDRALELKHAAFGVDKETVIRSSWINAFNPNK